VVFEPLGVITDSLKNSKRAIASMGPKAFVFSRTKTLNPKVGALMIVWLEDMRSKFIGMIKQSNPYWFDESWNPLAATSAQQYSLFPGKRIQGLQQTNGLECEEIP
jgi:hypothetical protein